MLLTGPPGSGKSAVAGALGTLLEVDEVPYGGIEIDQLSWGWPWLTLEQCLEQLRSLVASQLQAGRRLLLIVATPETRAELDAVLGAVGASGALVVCLSVSPELAARRVADREPDAWPGKAGLVEHSRVLAARIPGLAGIDAVIQTEDREAPAVADEIRGMIRARFGL